MPIPRMIDERDLIVDQLEQYEKKLQTYLVSHDPRMSAEHGFICFKKFVG